MNEFVQLLAGGVLLYFGAEWFVGGASALAVAMRVRPIVIGLTVVAYGTSAPEVIVGVEAARSGHGAVALGNVVGSNITNVGLILGVAAIVRPAHVHGSLRTRELPVLAISTIALPLLLLDGLVSRLESAGLLVAALLYTLWMVRGAKRTDEETAREEAAIAADAADTAGAPRAKGRFVPAVTGLVGLGVLLLGGQLFVGGAVTLATRLGMSERIVGLTIVAIGTSLPELVTSIIAARRGHSEIAVGNVVGSNIFNVLLCLGAAGLAGPVGAPFGSISFDLAALAVATAIVIVFTRTERQISRAEGALAIGMFVAFMAATVLRAQAPA